MSSYFSGVPERANTQTVVASWWNALRTAGMSLEAAVTSFFGSAFSGETQFTLTNNQAAFADVTGLLFDGAAVRSFDADVQIYRNSTSTGATELAARCKLIGTYKTVAAAWSLTVVPADGDAIDDFGPGGLIFDITAAGQVQYKSHNMSGTGATSKLKFRYTTMGVET